MLLYDYLIEKHGQPPAEERPQAIIEISNVIEYIMESDQEDWGLEDVLNFAPPFQVFWMEGVLGRRSDASLMESIKFYEKQGDDRAVMALGKELKEPGPRIRLGMHCMAKRTDDRPGWTVWLTTIATSLDLKIYGGTLMFEIVVSPSGEASWRRRPDGKIGYYGDMVPAEQHGESLPNCYAAMAGMAVSFMHCRNVELKKIERPKALNNRRRRKGREPYTDYQVIEITPVKKILEGQDGQHKHLGIRQRLHICRGHFKTYRQRGLFGKYVGSFWWPCHVRGDKKLGISNHDYRVKVEG